MTPRLVVEVRDQERDKTLKNMSQQLHLCSHLWDCDFTTQRLVVEVRDQERDKTLKNVSQQLHQMVGGTELE